MKETLRMESPVGALRLSAEGGALTELLFDDAQELRAKSKSDDATPAVAGETVRRAAAALEEYFAGARTTFDLPLALAGTDWERRVWAALLEVGYGETASYADIAKAVGNPKGVRAVGRANGRNPVSIIVPCHRIIGAKGALVGYGGGLPRKEWLLAHERRSKTALFTTVEGGATASR